MMRSRPEEKKIENKKPLRKTETMATFVKNDKNQNKGKAREESKKLTLKERKEVKYSFDDEDVEQIFDELLAAKTIKLPEPKSQMRLIRPTISIIADIIASSVIP